MILAKIEYPATKKYPYDGMGIFFMLIISFFERVYAIAFTALLRRETL